jgi:hypothetical protein
MSIYRHLYGKHQGKDVMLMKEKVFSAEKINIKQAKMQ